MASGKRMLRDEVAPTVFVFARAKKERKAPKARIALPPSKAKPREAQDSALPRTSTSKAIEQDEVEMESEACVQDDQLSPHTLQSSLSEVSPLIEKQAQEIERLKLQCSTLRDELLQAKATVYKLEGDNRILQCQLEAERSKTAAFCLDRFKGSNEDFMFYTGLPDYEHFVALMKYIHPDDDTNLGCRNPKNLYSRGRKRKLGKDDQLFLALVRLRLGLFEQDLAHRFTISQATVSRTCTTWISLLYTKLKNLPLWAPRETVDATMPAVFVEKYPATRVILDATEVKCAVPSSLALQSSTYSSYKSANTFKGLVGIMPNGLLSFVSELFTGSISDRELVIQSGFLDLEFDQGDVVMVDKGFRIADLLEEKGVGLNIPPFLHGRNFSEEEVKATQEIASLRIHVERRIQRIKSFHIFDRPIPLTLAPIINQIWAVVAILTNFQSDLISKQDSASAAC